MYVIHKPTPSHLGILSFFGSSFFFFFFFFFFLLVVVVLLLLKCLLPSSPWRSVVVVVEKMGRRPCCDKVGLKKGKWTAEEDEKLVSYIKENGEGSWRSLPKNAGLLRCGKSCRLRWINYLKDDLKRGNITPEEEETIIKLQASLGNRWSLIASHLTGRTDNEIKNHWNSHLSRRITPDPPVKKKRGRKAKSATATTGTTTTTKKNKKSKHQNKPPSSPKDESTQETTNSVITDEPNQSSPEVGSETLTVTTPDGSGATSSEKPTESGGSNGGEGDQVEFDMGDLDLEGLLGDDDLWKEVNGDLWSLGLGENDMMDFEQLGENGGHLEGEEGLERWFDWDLYSNDSLF